MASNKKLNVKIVLKLGMVLLIVLMVNPLRMVQGQTLPKIKSGSSMVVDSVNGQILYDYDEDKVVEAGGVSKALTLYTVMAAVKEGKFSLKDPVPISDAAYALSQDYDLANVPLRQDFKYTVDELIEAVAVNGANGATLALAEFVGNGSEADCVRQMEAHLKAWGIKDNKLYNSTGLPTELVPQMAGTYESGKVNQLSAKACAIAMYQLIQLHPKITEYSAQTEKTFMKETDDPYEMSSYNKLLSGKAKEYKGASGFLIGNSKNSGDSLIATATRSNLSVIAVTLGSGKKSADIHYADIHKVLDYTFATYIVEQVVEAGEPVTQVTQLKVIDGVKSVAQLEYQQDLSLVLPVIDTAPQISYEFTPDAKVFNKEGRVKAPIKEGTPVGTVKIDTKEMSSKYLPMAKGNHIPVVMQETIDKANWFQKTWQGTTQTISDSLESARQFFTDLFN